MQMMAMGFGFGWLGMFLFWAAVLVAAVFFIKYLVSQNNPRTEKQSALDILKSRYASGEISRDQYLDLKKDLMSI